MSKCKDVFGNDVPCASIIGGDDGKIGNRGLSTNKSSVKNSIVILVFVFIFLICLFLGSLAGYHAYIQHDDIGSLDKTIRAVVAFIFAPFYLLYTYLKISVFK